MEHSPEVWQTSAGTACVWCWQGYQYAY